MIRRAGQCGQQWQFVALGVFSLGLTWGSSVRADALPESPLSAMRDAAQAAADTEPDAAKWTRKQLPPASKNPEALSKSIRSAVHDEVSRVAAEGTLAPGRSGNTPAAGNGTGNGNGNGNSDGTGNGNGNSNGNSDRRGPSEMGLLHSAASSAQQAKRNVDVQSENGNGNGVKAHGKANAPGQNKSSLQVGAARR